MHNVLVNDIFQVYGVQALNNHESTPFYKELSDRSGGFYLQLKHFSLITDMFLAGKKTVLFLIEVYLSI